LPKPKQKTVQTQQNLGFQKNLLALPKKPPKKAKKQTRICLNGENLPEIPDNTIYLLQIFYKGEFMDSGIA
jgi:hypothetical protein